MSPVSSSLLSKALIFIDDKCDYIPFVSTVTNLFDIFEKAVLKAVSYFSKETGDDLKKSHYFKHIRDDKSLEFCVKLLVPFYGTYVKMNSKPEAPKDTFEQFIKDDENDLMVAKKQPADLKKNQESLLKKLPEAPRYENRIPVRDNRSINQTINDYTKKSDANLDRVRREEGERQAKAKSDFMIKYNNLREENDKRLGVFHAQAAAMTNDDLHKPAKLQLIKKMEEMCRSGEKNLLQIAESSGIDVKELL